MKTIIYHVISNIHLRNFLIFSSKYDNYKYILLIEKTNIKINNLLLNKIKAKKLYLHELYNKYNKILNNSNEDLILFLSTSQPRKNIIDLLYWSRINKIPTITYIETFQNFLHVGKLNNYLMPLDQIMVPNKIEYELFSDNNYNLNNIKIVNYPFHHKKIKKINENFKYNNKKKLLLILDASKKYNSINNYNYKDFNICINKVYSKFNKLYDISIKFHPLDENNFLNNLRYRFNNKINLVKGQDFIDIINNYDFFIFTGHSNAIIETLLNNKKFIIYKINNKNYINSMLKKIVFDSNSIDTYDDLDHFDYNFLYNILFENKTNEKNISEIIENVNFDLHNNDNYIFYCVWKIYYDNDFSLEYLDTKFKKNLLFKNLLNFNNNNNDIKKFYESSNQFSKNLYIPLLNIFLKKFIKHKNFELEKLFSLIESIPKDIYLKKIFENNIILIYKNLKNNKKNTFKRFLKENFKINIITKFFIKNIITYDK